MTQDEITLTVPRDRQFYPVAHLVLGGLAVRLNLTLESFEDLQVAVDGILDRGDASGAITMRVRVTDRGLEAELGPFEGDGLQSDLASPADDELGLRRILDVVVDDVSIVSRDDGAWVVLQKGISE